MNIYGKNSTAQSITAQIGIGATVAISDLTDLRDQFNAYSSTTGISAQLSADKASLMLVQDEGLDIVIENVDFADVTTNVNTTKFLQHHSINHKPQQGQLLIFMIHHIQPLFLIVSELVELLHFTHHSHFQLYQKLPMVVLLNQQLLTKFE